MSPRLPDLVIVGAPRSGTTTLTQWLRDHPDTAVSDRKELEFFDLYYERGLDWYLAQLPADPGHRVIVEATPSYLSDARAGERIAQTLPEARFVAVLREPVARAWSQYWFFVQLGLEKRSWRQAVEHEPSGEGPGYLWRGCYGAQIARWDALVGAERLQVLTLDALSADPDAALAAVCDHAGLRAVPAPSKEAVNPTRVPRSAALQRRLVRQSAGPVRRRLYAWNSHGRPVPRLPEEERQRYAPRFADDLAQLQQRLTAPLPATWGLPPRREA
jgi:LPS sulfotransferase NodH